MWVSSSSHITWCQCKRVIQEDDETFTFASDRKGYLYAASQVEDYMFRGTAFEDMNFLDFTVDTYEIQRERQDHHIMIDDHEEEMTASPFGRKRNVRGCYLESHPRYETHERLQRSKNHNYMPNVIGRWFPRRDVVDDEDFYFASLLSFLRPWRDLRQLCGEGRTWTEEGLIFLETATTEQRDVIAGMQYYYDSKHAAHNRSDEGDDEGPGVDAGLETRMNIDDEDGFESEIRVSVGVIYITLI